MGFAQGFATGAGLVNDHFEGLRREKADAEAAKAREAEAADRASRLGIEQERIADERRRYAEGAGLREAQRRETEARAISGERENSPEEIERRRNLQMMEAEAAASNASSARTRAETERMNSSTARLREQREQSLFEDGQLAVAANNALLYGVPSEKIRGTAVDPIRFIENREQIQADIDTVSAANEALRSGKPFDTTLTVNAINRLFRPKINVRQGETASGRYADRAGVSGWTIVDRNLDDVQIGPNGGMIWNLQVTARDPRNPNNTRTYLAPITEGRGPGGTPGEYGIGKFVDYVSSSQAMLNLVNQDPQRRSQYMAAVAALDPERARLSEKATDEGYAAARRRYIQENKEEINAAYNEYLASVTNKDSESFDEDVKPMSRQDFETYRTTQVLGTRAEYAGRSAADESVKPVTPSSQILTKYSPLFDGYEKVYGSARLADGRPASGLDGNVAMTMLDIERNSPVVAQLLLGEAARLRRPINPTWLEGNRATLTQKRDGETREEAQARLRNVIPQLFMTAEEGRDYAASFRNARK